MRTCVLSRRTGFPKKKATTSEDLKEAAQSGGLEEVDAKRKEPEEPRRKAADPWGSRREGGELRDPTEPLRNSKNPEGTQRGARRRTRRQTRRGPQRCCRSRRCSCSCLSPSPERTFSGRGFKDIDTIHTTNSLLNSLACIDGLGREQTQQKRIWEGGVRGKSLENGTCLESLLAWKAVGETRRGRRIARKNLRVAGGDTWRSRGVNKHEELGEAETLGRPERCGMQRVTVL